VRRDGTETWFTSKNQSDFFAVHDLTHYAVETELGYRHAFYGLVAAGRELNDFGHQEGQSNPADYHQEALWAENLVNTLQLGGSASYEQFVQMLEMTYPETSSHPSVTEEAFGSIVARMRDVIGRWRTLKPEETLELEFPD
jgi:hypothetical protein